MLQKQEVNFNKCNSVNYQRTQMQKDMILHRLKEQGLRITRQRMMLLDIILEEEFTCCKEIFYKASKQDPKIGCATVYRMINTLEDIGAISRKNLYRIECTQECSTDHACKIEFEDDTVMELSATHWNQVLQSGLKACGYLESHKQVRNVVTNS